MGLIASRQIKVHRDASRSFVAKSRRWTMASSAGRRPLTGMPKTDLSPWLTSPLDMMKVVQEIDATTEKREEMEKCQEGTPGMRRKRRKRRGGRGQQKILAVRGWKRKQETNTQSGRPGGRIYRNIQVLPPGLADISRTRKFLHLVSSALTWPNSWDSTTNLVGLIP